MKKFLILAILGVVLLSVQSRADASTRLIATLEGSQEFPPNASMATGFATFELNDAMTALTYNVTIFDLDFTGFLTPANAQTPNPADDLINAHIHASATNVPGVNAGVVFGFIGAPFNEDDIVGNPIDVVVTPFTTPGVAGGMVSGKWDALEGNNTTLTAQLANILGGHSYINFHTRQFGGGEIRGQIQVVPEPSTLLLLGSGLAGVIAFGRKRLRKKV